MTSPSSVTLLLLALSLPADPPVPLCLTVGEQSIAVELTDAPSGQVIRFSPLDRERIAAELRPLGVPEDRIEAATGATYRRVMTEAVETTCGTCYIGFVYKGRCWPKRYDDASPWCLSCKGPCPPGPEPIAEVRP